MYSPNYFLVQPNIINKKYITCGTLNIKTLARRKNKIINLATRNKIDLLFLQETKAKIGHVEIFKSYELLYYGKSTRDGVGILIKPWLKKYIETIKFYTPYLAEIVFNINSHTWTCINFYGKSGGSSKETSRRINKLLSITKPNSNVSIFGDFNFRYNKFLRFKQRHLPQFNLLTRNEPSFFYQNKTATLDYILSSGKYIYKSYKNSKPKFTDHALLFISICYDFFNFTI